MESNHDKNTDQVSQSSHGKMSRRRWFGLTFLGGAALTCVSVLPPLFEDQPDQIIKQVLKHKLAPAQIPDKTYEAFLEMFKSTEHYVGLGKAYKILSSVAFLYPTGLLHRLPTFKNKMKIVEELVITHFTLSTNFFYDTAVQTGEKPVAFISYWRLRACNNPFATFDTTTSNTPSSVNESQV